MIAKEIFQNFEGAWLLKRKIIPHGSFLGTAKFSRINDVTLAYEEEGILTLNEGQVLDDVTKRYLYKLEEGAIAVYFNDGPDKGKLFHRLDFNDDSIATATHDCPPDIYLTKMHLKFPDAFYIIHEVNGSRKDYKIKSFYERAA